MQVPAPLPPATPPPPGTPPDALFSGAIFILSPNQDARPAGVEVDCVVVHATVIDSLEGVVAHFLKPESRVSSHYVVGKDGRGVQMVADNARAWHAGGSELEGRRSVNDFSVGIEIVNLNDGKDPFTEAQYEVVAAIIRHVREHHDVPVTRIVSHAYIARPPGRKSDPVGFDFTRLCDKLKKR
jgi:N-acetylmuramoyl-L-alanine amidase